VLLSDTLLERFSPEEIEAVLGHELGHQRYRHITIFLALSGAGSALAFSLVQWSARWWVGPLGLEGLADPAGFPTLMLALSLVGLVGLPLQNGLSRAFEWQSDRFAVALTHTPQAFASALKKLGELNLADPSPPRWVVWLFYDHPPIAERIHRAEQS
jgi:STE24 endopeptidase